MIDNEECECPLCQYLSTLPTPRNREERRIQEKEVRTTVKKLYYFQMTRMRIEAIKADLMRIQKYGCCCGMDSI
jgi:hypothetical protein